jgi:hypothetical protein
MVRYGDGEMFFMPGGFCESVTGAKGSTLTAPLTV